MESWWRGEDIVVLSIGRWVLLGRVCVVGSSILIILPVCQVLAVAKSTIPPCRRVSVSAVLIEYCCHMLLFATDVALEEFWSLNDIVLYLGCYLCCCFL